MRTELFVYGTLRHDQPEHRIYCRGVAGWRPASLRGELWRVRSGYLIALVPAGDVLLRATANAAADEARRSAVARTGPSDGSPADVGRWIPGELLAFEDAAAAWPALDGWEDFTPGGGGAYQRCVVPVRLDGPGGARESIVAAWAYVATRPPPGAVRCGSPGQA